jgi:uncharacterized repeat protein (TIGR01451 family)/fimbrial isopeptide formation D2 family protein
MFRKLLSNLPFNPSLINEVSFYAKRIHQEQGIRRSGLVLIALSLLVQMFAVIAPPEASFARAGNDIVPGGVTNKTNAIKLCDENTYNFRNILHRFDIDCTNMRNTTFVSGLKSTDEGRSLLSLGRAPYNKEGERPITGILGEASPLYLRFLWSWDTGLYSTYPALKGTNTKGQPFWVLIDCGNVVIKDTPEAPPIVPVSAPKKPKVEITSKTTLPGTPKEGSKVQAGDVLGYRIYFRNAGDGDATNVFVEDSTPTDTSFVKGSQGSGAANRYDYTDSVYPGHGQEPHVYWAYNKMPAGATGYYVDFKVKVNSGIKDGAQICNRAYIRSNENAQTWSNKVCHTAYVPNTRVTVQDVCTNIPGTQTDVPTDMVRDSRGNCTTPPTTSDLCKNIEGVQTTVPTGMNRDSSGNCVFPPVTKPCVASTSPTDVASCLELHKTARNDTKGIDANNTTAAPGDVITYTLTTKNYSTQDLKDYVIQENLIDIMEYTDKITNADGGTLGNDRIMRWPATTIKAGQTVTHTLTIKIKNPIPNTPTPPSNPGSFDLMLTNVYGDAINIKLPGSVAAIVSHTNTTLPNTGPGQTMVLAALITFVAAYCFARSRLMAKELDLVREDYATSGGV